MPTKPKKPATIEPLQDGDEQVARAQIEAYYQRRVERAADELAKSQHAYERATVESETALAALDAGDRLTEMDAAFISMMVGSEVTTASEPLVKGTSTDRTAYDEAVARRDATRRWMRAQGYDIDAR